MKHHKAICMLLFIGSLLLAVRGFVVLYETAVPFTYAGRAEGTIVGTRSADNTEWENIEFVTPGGTYNMYGNEFNLLTNDRIGQSVTVWYDTKNPVRNSLPVPKELILFDITAILAAFACAGISVLMYKPKRVV